MMTNVKKNKSYRSGQISDDDENNGNDDDGNENLQADNANEEVVAHVLLMLKIKRKLIEKIRITINIVIMK